VCVDGRVSFALDGGDAAIPTMVYVPASGPLVVGKEALRLGFSDPFNVVTSVKRLLGLGWGDPAPRALDAGSSFALHQGPGGQVLIRIQKQELAPVQLAAAVLARLRKLAEARFDELDEAPEFISTAISPGCSTSTRRGSAGGSPSWAVVHPRAGDFGVGSDTADPRLPRGRPDRGCRRRAGRPHRDSAGPAGLYSRAGLVLTLLSPPAAKVLRSR